MMHRNDWCLAAKTLWIVLCGLAAGSLSCGPLVAADWSQFRGPGGMGVAPDAEVPLHWTANENLVWKTALPGAGASSPIVSGQQVYLTAYTGYFVPGENTGSLDMLKRQLLAFDLRTGRLLWTREVPARLPEEDKIRDHGYAANTPAADADHVYVFFGKTGVFAFDHDGQQKWHAEVGDGTNGWGTSASPVVDGDLVFVNASVESESLIALDRRTGQEKWRVSGIREAWNTPVLVQSNAGRQELVIAVQGKVLAFDPQTGDRLWSCNTDITWYMVPSIVAGDGVVYCLGGRSGVAALAVRTGGQGDVTSTHRLWTGMKGSNVTSPVLHDGHLYWVHEQRGIAYCARAATGEIVYEQPLDRAGQFYSSALLASGRLYYTTRQGKTFVLAAEPVYRSLAVNDLSDRSQFDASPAVVGNQLLLRSDRFLYCIGADR